MIDISMRGKRASRIKIGFGFLLAAAIAAVVATYLRGHNIPVLEPHGTVGRQERNLIFLAAGLCAIVVIPVFVLTIFIALKYREGNTRPKKYRPDYDHSRILEITWWAIPIIIIGALSVVAWNSSHSLDPYRVLATQQKPMTIRVVALDWKWLFIYPSQNLASVNFAQIPLNTPVEFQITSDSVMNSFWVPALGGQIYAMPGMVTQLHLMADKAGDYNGSSANISGQGFAGMNFTVRAGSQAGFNSWVKMAKRSPSQLSQKAYDKLVAPSQNNPVTYYSSVQGGLFSAVAMKYMMPATGQSPNPSINAPPMNMPGMAM